VTAGLTIVADGWNYCFSDKATPDQLSYWVRFSDGSRFNRVYEVPTPDPVFLVTDLVTKLRLPTTLGCSKSSGIITFAPT
jgi:hypothetical protein